jgi:hypothetical protein
LTIELQNAQKQANIFKEQEEKFKEEMIKLKEENCRSYLQLK